MSATKVIEKNEAGLTFLAWLELAEREPSGMTQAAWKNNENPNDYKARGNIRKEEENKD